MLLTALLPFWMPFSYFEAVFYLIINEIGLFFQYQNIMDTESECVSAHLLSDQATINAYGKKMEVRESDAAIRGVFRTQSNI